jgi:hypothetical protein
MTMHEPRAGVVREEANRCVIGRLRADANDVTLGRIHVVVRRVSGGANNGEDMSVEVNRVLRSR